MRYDIRKHIGNLGCADVDHVMLRRERRRYPLLVLDFVIARIGEG